jgi:hypothetical protein
MKILPMKLKFMRLHIAMMIKLMAWRVNDRCVSCHDIINVSNFGSGAEDVYCGLILSARVKTIPYLYIGPSVIFCDVIYSHFFTFNLQVCIIKTTDFSDFIWFLIEKIRGPSIYGATAANVAFTYSCCVP